MRLDCWGPGVLIGLLTACDNPVTCTLEARAGINIEVRDSVTAAPAAAGALGIARDGSFADTLLAIGGSLAGAWERAGTYQVTITKTGYQDWSAAGVTVAAGECHVTGVSLQARLKPL